MTEMPLRIAMWSGPRNISTAMMRAFENRPDCVVSDEPFYAAFLAETGLAHPMRDEVLASQPTDWRAVAAAMAGPPPEPAPIWYQKQMCHHMLPAFGLDWMDACTNAFLIRDPAAVVASYARKHDEASLDAIGVVRQCELFDRVAERTGTAPAVIDSAWVLADPHAALTALCRAIAIPFSPAMLAWPAGRRPSDGVWAPAWYDVVERSTGFDRPQPHDPAPLPAAFARVAEAARPYYERMAAHTLRKPA